MGKGYLDFSDQDYGKASILKVLGNSIIFSAVEGLAEGLTIAEKSGVGVDPLVQFVENMFPGKRCCLDTYIASDNDGIHTQP